jgi:hypothetical protein
MVDVRKNQNNETNNKIINFIDATLIEFNPVMPSKGYL